MAGTLAVDTIQNGSGASVPTTTVINGSAKAWVNFNGAGAATIRASFNVSSVTFVGTGNYVVNYTNAFEDTNYTVAISGRRDSSDSNFCVQLRGSLISGGALYSTTQTAITAFLPNAVTPANGDIMCLIAFR